VGCLIDTSIWIQLHRGNLRPTHVTLLRELAGKGEAAVCGQVWVEFIGGFRSPDRRRAYAYRLAQYRWLPTDADAFKLAAEWVARHRGIGPGDAIIAASAIRAGASLLTADAGFGVLESEGLRLANPLQ
jgi:predicted nucleic acid-binding protein